MVNSMFEWLNHLTMEREDQSKDGAVIDKEVIGKVTHTCQEGKVHYFVSFCLCLDKSME